MSSLDGLNTISTVLLAPVLLPIPNVPFEFSLIPIHVPSVWINKVLRHSWWRQDYEPSPLLAPLHSPPKTAVVIPSGSYQKPRKPISRYLIDAIKTKAISRKTYSLWESDSHEYQWISCSEFFAVTGSPIKLVEKYVESLRNNCGSFVFSDKFSMFCKRKNI